MKGDPVISDRASSLYRNEVDGVDVEGLSSSEAELDDDARSAETSQEQEPPVEHRWFDVLSTLWALPGWTPDLEADSQQLDELAAGPNQGDDFQQHAWAFQGFLLTADPRLADPGRIKLSWWRHCTGCPVPLRPRWEPPEREEPHACDDPGRCGTCWANGVDAPPVDNARSAEGGEGW